MNNVIHLPARRPAGALNEARVELRIEGLIDLARQMPSLETIPGIDPFMPRLLDDVLLTITDLQELHSGRFLLAIWNPSASWRSGAFDAMAALQAWDDDHRLTFMSYVVDPFWVHGPV